MDLKRKQLDWERARESRRESERVRERVGGGEDRDKAKEIEREKKKPVLEKEVRKLSQITNEL